MSPEIKKIIEELESIASTSQFSVIEFRHDRLTESIDRLIDIRSAATIAMQDIKTLMRNNPHA